MSRKFISGDGGLKRLVWMPKELKEFYKEKNFDKRAEEEGVPGLLDMIGDETVATTGEELVEHLTKTGHPAMEMEALF